MKRVFSLVFLCLFLLTGCEKPEQADAAALPLPEAEGVAPYEFSPRVSRRTNFPRRKPRCCARSASLWRRARRCCRSAPPKKP